MTDNRLRIGFMGTPDFALEALKALHQTEHEIVCVYSQPPRPKGRGHKVQPSPVHNYAAQQNIPVFHPKSLKTAEAQEEFASHNLDVAIVAAYGLILPKAILEAPKFGCINIHASILPRWRGASPIQHAIWKGDSETGVTLMQMDEGLDTGAMIATQTLPITMETAASALHDDLAALGGEMIVDAMNELAESRTHLKSVQQDNDQSTYAPLLKKNDGRIDWSNNSRAIDRQIRALNPWPGVYTDLAEARFKILEARPVPTQELSPPGTILDKDGTVVCGENTALKITILQPQGKKAMDFASALNGGYLKPGDQFS